VLAQGVLNHRQWEKTTEVLQHEDTSPKTCQPQWPKWLPEEKVVCLQCGNFTLIQVGHF